MKRRGRCVHQQNVQASKSPSSNNPVPKRNVAAAACLRLYAEGVELKEHKEQLYCKFGLEKVPIKRSPMGSTTASTTSTSSRDSRSSEPSLITNSSRPTAKPGVNPGSKVTAVATKRSSTLGIGPRFGDVTALGSPSKDRRSNTMYVPPGGRSPTTTIKQVFAKTFSLHSTMESRAAVAPRRKGTNTSKKPPSPKGSTARKDGGAAHMTLVKERPTSAHSTAVMNTAKTRRVSSANASIGRGGVPQPVHQSLQQYFGIQLLQTNNRTSFSLGIDSSKSRGSRASVVSPGTNVIAGRRPSTAPSQQQSPQKTRTYSTIFQQQQQQQQRQDPVLIQVSRRTSSPIVSPVGRHRPSVAPIGPALCPRGDFDAVASPGPAPNPRASLVRRETKLEKLQEQVNVLKASFGLSEEDLLWKVESAKGNAFLAADKHLANSEERYDRLVFEMQELSQPARCADEDKANIVLATKLRSLEKQAHTVAELRARATTYQNDMVQTKKILLAARVEAELQRAKLDSSAASKAAALEIMTARKLENIKEGLLSAQQQLKVEQGALQELLEWLGSETDRFGDSVAAEDLSPSPVVSGQTLETKRTLLYTLRAIPECTQGSERLSTLCSQATQLAVKITASRAHDLKRTEVELERTMRDVEIWKTRREQAKEFADEMRNREALWQLKQREQNNECLSLMRTFIPIDIAELSVEALIAKANEGPTGPGSGTLYTYDLASYLKTNRFLQWLVTHEDDIARANFLATESAPFFMDFINYDINELRALTRVLPDSFAFDKDGRKNAWRTTFIDHVRQLTAQELHETIKAGWDPVKRTRREVQLPELTARQQLNPIFCYPTDAEIDSRLDKFERQRARLDAKRIRVRKLDDELIPQAKAEYVAVAEDARNEDLQRSFGKSTLISLREEAKQHHLALCKERDTVKGELAHGDRAWAAMAPSFEQYQAEVAQIRALDPEIRNAPRIRGPFPADIDIQPRERAAFKKLSVEEEAEARKRELDNAIAKRSSDISEIAVEKESNIGVNPATSVVVVEPVVLSGAELEATRLMQLEDKHPPEPVQSTAASNEATVTPQRGFAKVKSLQVAVRVLQFLENDLCSPKRVLQGKEGSFRSPSQKTVTPELEETDETSGKTKEQIVRTPRGSRSLPPTLQTNGRSTKEDAKPAPVVVPPKSKALLKLLETQKAKENGNAPNAEVSMARVPPPSPFGGRKVNFLGELQNRFQRKPSAAASSDGEQTNVTTGARKPTSVLDELKGISTREASGVAASSDKKPMNFLDELKSASIRKAVSTAENTDVAQPGTPCTPRNFLDELRARAGAAS